MNQITIGLAISSVKSESPTKGYRESQVKSPNFEEMMKKVSKKEETKVVGTKEKVNIRNKKINLEAVTEAEKVKPEEEILAVIAQYLMISPKEIEEVLAKLQMDALGLLDQEKFGMFLTELYGQSMEELLMGNSQVKSVGELWESLQSTRESIGVTIEEIDLESLEEVEGVEIVSTQSQTISNGETIQENRLLSDGTTQVVYKDKSQTEDVLSGPDDSLVLETNKLSALGLQIPIKGIGKDEGFQLNNHLLKEEFMNKAFEHKPISNQILNKLEITTLSESKEIYMDLTPRELGKLSIKLVEGNGVFTAQIQVESEKTKELILHNLQELKEGLEKQGMIVGEFDVNVRDQSKQSQMQQERQKSAKRIEEIMAKHLLEIEEKEKQEEQLVMSEVDLMA